MKYNPMELSDFYKQGHAPMYPDGLTYLTTYMTPRMSRMENERHLTVFGVQGFCQEYLIEKFSEGFFKLPLNRLLDEMDVDMNETFTQHYIVTGKVADLHKLGYLPVRVSALPEGTRSPVNTSGEIKKCFAEGMEVPLSVPVMMIENTHPDFAWVAEFLESISSCQLWRSMCIANVGYNYRQIVNKHWEKSVVGQPARTAISEFGFRGEEGLESAVQASTAFLTSFDKTATIPAIKYLQHYYGGDITRARIASGMISTEHSVMCSNYAVDGDEDTFMKKLFTQIYPNGNISVVVDSYDHWGRIKALGTTLKPYVLEREGTLFVRGDSGDPIEILCGTNKYKSVDSIEDIRRYGIGEIRGSGGAEGKANSKYVVAKYDGKKFQLLNILGEARYYRVGKRGEQFKYVAAVWNTGEFNLVEVEPDLADIGTIEALYNYYGGTVNEKGFIVLNDKVRGIYGDSITVKRADIIYDGLETKGFAANNVALGAGSFSMQCMEVDGGLSPFTRDSYGIAVKATYCEIKGKPYQIFKDPATDTGKFKKSQKGMIYVYRDESGKIMAKDGYTRDTLPTEGNLMQVVFEDGHMVNETTIHEIRDRLHNNKF